MKTPLPLFAIKLVVLLFTCSLHAQDFFKERHVVNHIKGSDTLVQINFNPVCSFEDFKLLEKRQKNSFKDRGSFFLVFSSNAAEEVDLIELKDSKHTINVSSNKVVVNGGNTYEVAFSDGGIISYLFLRNHFTPRNNGLHVNTSISDFQTSIAEFIYFPEVLNVLDKTILESYLSIKYGYSLEANNYISSKRDTIWNVKDHTSFTHRFTALGRDDQMGLYQKRSMNSDNKSLVIGLNDTEISEDCSYLMWSDNNGSVRIGKEKLLDRTWEITSYGKKDDFSKANLFINPTLFFEDDDQILQGTDLDVWIVLSSTSDFSSEKKYIRCDLRQDDLIEFRDVDFSKHQFFSFIVAPSFFVDSELEGLPCSLSQNLKLQPIGGVAPYQLTITSPQFQKQFTLNSNETFEIEVLADTYQIDLVDSFGSNYETSFTVQQPSLFEATMSKEWVLLEGQDVFIIPQVSTRDSIILYEWIYQNEVISNSETLQTNKTGSYKLNLHLKDECVHSYSFEVVYNDDLMNEIQVYPNTIPSGHPFYIDFNFHETKNVNLHIFDIHGKSIESTKLHKIQSFQYTTSLLVSGVYMLMFGTETTTVVKRIIVQ